MKKITFLKTFIQTRWLHHFKSREAVESYQKKQLANYMDFLKRESPYFKNGVPSDFDHMDKAFMMEHFNELNTQGVDRDEALNLAIESEKTRDFTELKGEVAVGLSSGTSGHRGLFITTEKERSMWAAAILAKMGQFVFRTQLAEQYLENIHLGDSISLAFNAYKDLKTTAKITKISSKGTLENGIMKYTLEAEFPVNAQMPVIRSGYSATAEIVLNSKKNVPSIEEKYIGYKNDSTYVWVKNGATLEKKYIELGISDGKYTEVTKGLTTNDKIVQNDSAQ